jgi:hypothetical protein
MDDASDKAALVFQGGVGYPVRAFTSRMFSEVPLDNSSIIAAIDAEIERLQEAKRLLLGAGVGANRVKSTTRRRLSAQARAKIAAAQRKRWAAAKKSAK